MENLPLLTNLIPSPYPLGLSRRGCSTGFSSDMGQLLRLPAEANPLADVVGQTSPHSFQSHLDQTTQAKLTQPNFIFDPRIGKLRHPSPLLIDGLSFRRLHLGLKGGHLGRRFTPYHRSPSLRPRATLGLKATPPTVRNLRSVAASHRSPRSFLRLIRQHFPRRTSTTVSTRIILKGLRVKVWTHPTLLHPLLRHSPPLRQGPDQIHLLLGHRLHRGLIRKSPVYHHLLRFLSQVGFDSLRRRFQFRSICGRLSRPYPDNDLGFRVRRNLHVITRTISAFGSHHYTSIRIRTAGPWLLLLRCLGPRHFHLFQCLDGLLRALLLLPQCSLLCLNDQLTQFLRPGISHLLHLLPGQPQVILKRRLSVKTVIR